jgi:hypothetical protein
MAGLNDLLKKALQEAAKDPSKIREVDHTKIDKVVQVTDPMELRRIERERARLLERQELERLEREIEQQQRLLASPPPPSAPLPPTSK